MVTFFLLPYFCKNTNQNSFEFFVRGIQLYLTRIKKKKKLSVEWSYYTFTVNLPILGKIGKIGKYNINIILLI